MPHEKKKTINRSITYQSEEDALDDETPTSTEIAKLVRFHNVGFGQDIEHDLGQSHDEGDDDQNTDEKHQTGHEDIGLLNVCAEADAVDATNNNVLEGGLVSGHDPSVEVGDANSAGKGVERSSS